MSAPGRLSLADDVQGCVVTPDDFVDMIAGVVEERCRISHLMERLFRCSPGYTLADAAKLLDSDFLTVSFALAYMTQAGAVFKRFPVAGGEIGYKLLGWVE